MFNVVLKEIFSSILKNFAANGTVNNNGIIPAIIIKNVSVLVKTVKALPKNNVSICVISCPMVKSDISANNNVFLLVLFDFVIIKMIVAQTQAYEIIMNKSDDGSVVALATLKLLENGIMPLAIINNIVAIITSATNLNTFFIMNLL